MAAGGQLQISIVEGRNLRPKPGSVADPFISLELGGNKVETDPKPGQVAPKWLKDVKLPLNPADAASSDLLVSAGDGAKRGDAPFGTAKIPVGEVAGGSTMVKWYELKDAAGNSVGEVCLVLRFVKAPLSSPVAAPNGSAVPPAAPEGGIPKGAEPPKVVADPEAGAKVDDKPPPAAVDASDKLPESSGAGDGTGGGSNWAANGTNVILSVGGAILAAALASLLFAGGKRKAKGQEYEVRPAERKTKAEEYVAPPATKAQEYVVQKGDTFCSIAGCYDLAPRSLISANKPGFVDPNKIFPGDRIYIP